jgi:negative regulator of sigma E activity
MSERLDAYLDGELPRDDLSAAEAAQAAAFEAKVGELRGLLGAAAPGDMDTRVLRRIAELGLEPLPARRHGFVHRSVQMLWAAHDVHLRWRPAYPLAAAAMLAAVIAVQSLRGPAADQTDTVAAPVYVQFRLHMETARQVALAGSFSDWQPAYALQQVAEGVWTIMLPITPGVHDYAFVVDGEQWVPDPYAPQVDDGFGGANSRLTVLAPADS